MKLLAKTLFFCSALLLLASSKFLYAQAYQNKSELSLEDIMKGIEWMGSSPERAGWNMDGKEIHFQWNPEKELFPSDYKYVLADGEISKLNIEERKSRIQPGSTISNSDKSKFLYARNGNLFTYNSTDSKSTLMLDLDESISSPRFSKDEMAIFYLSGSNLYKYLFGAGEIRKLTNFVKEERKAEKKKWSNEQEEWLYKDQMELFDILKQNEKKSEIRKLEREKLEIKGPLAIAYGKSRVSSIEISGDERFISFLKFTSNSSGKRTEMPRYVNESGFTSSDNVRAKVGYSYGEIDMGIYDTQLDTFYYADLTELPGIFEQFIFEETQRIITKDEVKPVFISSPLWSPKKDKAVLAVRSLDNKDRWIATVDFETGLLKCIDHQRDEAWISGPGIGWSMSTGTLGWLEDNRTIFFQSEESGYSHLYLYDLVKEKKSILTQGEYEIFDAYLSNDKKSFYYSSNEIHSGEKHFYQMNVRGGKKKLLTTKAGHNIVSLSPDEKTMLVRYSYANKPWELYIRKCDDSGVWGDYEQITDSYTSDFKSYLWREPDFISVEASDGEKIPARIYKPEKDKKNGCAVVFVHGAGYLQNAHKGWSSYYREYMFHNFLVDNGYTVLDMDFRASAGYGRDWRTAIYRHMGGKDLSDNIDGAKYLIENEEIDENKLGIYGGSYGGFITLMAQFTAPGVFKAGVALRPVTDWAHYNHSYTANILNTPVKDSLSYRRSSPIYFADGLEDHLIMCHGMLDDNVHYQDVVRLSQRLIELQKDDWELASYPIEPHGFREWTSWLDEYKRIYKLFERTMRLAD